MVPPTVEMKVWRKVEKMGQLRVDWKVGRTDGMTVASLETSLVEMTVVWMVFL